MSYDFCMRRHSEDRNQLHLWEKRTDVVTRPRILNERITRTHRLFEDALDATAESNDMQPEANAIIALSDQHPLPCFAVARALIDMGVVRNAYDFSFGTEDDCLMMVMDRERGSLDFMERALKYAASGREGDADSIEEAWNLLSALSFQQMDNLACAEKLAAMHFRPTEVTPKAIRLFWERFRKAYACFLVCVESRLATSLPVLHMIAKGQANTTSWQEANAAWREQFGSTIKRLETLQVSKPR